MSAFEIILAAAIHLTIPLAFAALGECVAERAGTLNISLEGMMLCGAFAAVAIGTATGSPTMGLLLGSLAGVLVAAVHAFFSHFLAVNTFVVGLTLNVAVLGLTSILSVAIVLSPVQISQWSIPGLSSIPVLGDAVFTQRWAAFMLLPLIPACWWLLYRTRWGLELRAVGENPQSADVSGIHVNRRRRQALLFCGLMAGLGGAYLAVGEVGSFNDNMTAGRGFVVLAAVIFGGWRLKMTLVGCLLFGTADALRLAMPALGYQISSPILIAAPYVLAIAAMLFLAKKQRAPKALSKPFERGLV
jgi:simple sugar transport system permease protein